MSVPVVELRYLADALKGMRVLPAKGGVRLRPGADALEDARLLEDNLQELEAKTGLAPLTPSSLGAAREAFELRVRAARRRLEHLGYPVKDVDSGRMDGELLKVLNVFRREAGLEVAGAIDEPAWEALQELVALERPFHIDRWYPAGGAPLPALLRAVRLRLTTLGLRENKPVGSEPEAYLRIQLARFRAVAWRLGILPSPTASEREAMAALFDQDRLLEGVARGNAAVREDLRGLGLSEERLDASRRFLLRLARNELWLDGHPVGDLREPVDARKLGAALRVYWEHTVGLPAPEAEARARGPGLEFFEDQARQRQAPLVSREQLTEFVVKNERELQGYWVEDVPNSNFFLWDGLVRAFRWLGRQVARLAQGIAELVRRSIEFARALVKNVFRSLFHSANEVLAGVKRAVVAFVDGVGTYVRGEVASTGEGPRVLCKLNADGDSVLWVPSGSTPESAAEVVRRVERTAAALALASSVLALAVGLVAKAARGLFGWLSLIALLVRAGPGLLQRVRALAALG